MEAEHAKPGDTIEVTWDGCEGVLLGKRVTVIERPSNMPGYRFGYNPGDAWFINEDGAPSYWTIQHYKIVQGTTARKDVDQKLEKQRDANLKSFFPSIFQL